MTPSAISQNREKQNGAADCVFARARRKPVTGGNQMSSASVLQQSFVRASDRPSTGSALAEQFSPEDIIEFGEFRINIRNRTVALCGQHLELTTAEFDVLVFLISHPQRLITPHTLLTTNWTTNHQRQTEFLRALLSLRKKLDAASPGKRYLRTEPWVVYRFDPNPSSKLSVSNE